MSWSIVEPAVGAVVSSVPAITAIRHLFNGSMSKSYGSTNSMKSRGDGHVQLKEYGNTSGTKSTVDGPWKGGEESESSIKKDNDSEEHLVSGAKRDGISRTTEIHVSYD